MSPDSGPDCGHALRLGRRSYRSYKTVASAGNGFQKPGIIGRVVQGLAELPYRRVQRGVKLYKRIVRPQLLMDFFSGDELTWMLQQLHKNPKRLLLQTNPRPHLGELAFLKINLEGSKTNKPACWYLLLLCAARVWPPQCATAKF